MSAFKSVTVALLLSMVPLTPSFAQFSEPAAFASQHPDRDVLNGGALTPEARGGVGLDSVRGIYNGVGSMNPQPRHHERSRRQG